MFGWDNQDFGCIFFYQCLLHGERGKISKLPFKVQDIKLWVLKWSRLNYAKFLWQGWDACSSYLGTSMWVAIQNKIETYSAHMQGEVASGRKVLRYHTRPSLKVSWKFFHFPSLGCLFLEYKGATSYRSVLSPFESYFRCWNIIDTREIRPKFETGTF